MKRTIIALILLCSGIVYSQQNTDYERLAKVCEYWGLIKYFNPRQPGSEFDSAFAANLPSMLNATTNEEWNSAITRWLSVLDDNMNRIVKSRKLPDGEIKSEFTKDSVLVVTINGRIFFEELYPAMYFLRNVLVQAQVSKGIVFDLRQSGQIPSVFNNSINDGFKSNGLDKYFATEVVPQYNSVYYSGYKGEIQEAGQYYSKNMVIHDCTDRGNYTGNKIVWIVNKYSELPCVALSLQASGKAIILSETSDVEMLLPFESTLQFTDDTFLNFRVSELLMPDNRKVKADYVYSASENPVELGLKFISEKTPNKNNTEYKNKQSASTESFNDKKETYPSVGYRILAAAKIYSVIENFFPYRKLMENDWQKVLVKSLPEFVNAKDDVEYGLAVAKMYAYIQDSHGFIVDNKGQDKVYGEAPSPMIVERVEEKAVVTRLRNDSVCVSNGISVGDIILRVNNIPVEDLLNKNIIYFSHSTPQSIMSLMTKISARGDEGKTAVYTIQDKNGNIRDVELKWTEKNNKNIVSDMYKYDTLALLEGNIGYADLTRMDVRQTDEMFDKFKDTKAIIFDMRGYPNGTAWSIAPRLTEKINVPVAIFRKPEVMSPNLLNSERLSNRSIYEFVQTIPVSEKWKYQGKTVMLIDHNAISQAEHTCLFFKEVNNTTFIGTPTKGANGDVTAFVIPGGMTLYFTGQGVYWVDGRQLQRIGIQPDIYVSPTIKGIIEGKDEIFDKAVEWINENVK